MAGTARRAVTVSECGVITDDDQYGPPSAVEAEQSYNHRLSTEL